MRIVGVDHVQLAMPAGGEDAARRFYGAVLGLEEVPKPAALTGRGGAWFQSGGVRLHLG
jgi:catechol 2,3-dioxygenase-like lactoylglutathione lyase family enzyme